MLADQVLLRRISTLRDVWSQYIQSKRQFLITAERCCVRGWPDKKAEIRNAFRLQELYCERERLRFEHLAAAPELNASVHWQSLNSLSAISKSIDTEWNDHQEAALRDSNPDYMSICEEIDKCGAVLRTDNTGPFTDAQRDPEYARARQAAADAIAACDQRLAL
jgi:hypothetical protein